MHQRPGRAPRTARDDTDRSDGDRHPDSDRNEHPDTLTHRNSGRDACADGDSRPSPTTTPTATPTATPAPTSTATPTPTPTAPTTTFRYDRYDATGAVAERGSYAFLADAGEAESVVTTYERLRDGSATTLRIHETDADGVSRATFLDTVEVGDLFEWKQADDCWVRYRVSGVSTASGDTREFAIKSYSHTYTGCSGAIGGSAARQFTWAPETLKTGDFPVPTWHGPWLLIPTSWTGPAPDPSDPAAYAAVTPPAITWPPDPLPDPDLGPGWRGGVHMGYGELEGWYSHSDGGSLSVYMFQVYDWPLGIYRTGAPYDQAERINEFPIIDGRPAHVAYDRVKDNTSEAQVVIYDPATGVIYNVRGGPISRKNDPEATIEIAKKFILPPAGPPPTTFRYDTSDTSGEVAEPGSYAFLANPADTTSAVTTYEGLRDGSATSLRIHETDADGVSRAAFYETVEVGDLFEWQEADDCFVRYKVTEVKPDPSGAVPRKLLAVEWMTYAFTGCSGGVPATSASTMEWRPPDAIQSPTLTSPVRHGQYLLIPTAWDGPMAPGEKGDDPLRLTGILVEPQVDVAPPPHYRASIDAMSPTERVLVETSDPAEARRLIPLWRDPVLPEGWTLQRAEVGTPDAPFHGYMAEYVDARGYPALLLYVSYPDRRPDYRWVTSASNSTSTYEVRTVDGHAALVRYSPPGPLHNRYKATKVQIFDEATGIKYWLLGQHDSLSGANVDATIEIARSLFESPPTPPTTFRYDRYDTTGAVAEPGSYAFLSDPADTTSAVTTYEGLRDGSATTLRIHETDADGVSRAAFLDTVEAGDLFEWREAEDCWVRYRVTSAPGPAAGAVSRELMVRWVTYTYTGCSGAVDLNEGREIAWSPPDVRSPDITVPVRHGPWTLRPPGWEGPLEGAVQYPRPATLPDPDPGTTMPFVTADIAEARSTIPLWREPTVPEDWTFSGASMGDPYGYDYGYNAAYQVGSGLNHVSIEVFYSEWRPVSEAATGHESAVQRELRIVDGRPALLIYSPPGPNHDEGYPISVWVFDDATGIQYRVSSHTPDLRGSNIEPVIAIARSLVESPNPR